MVYTDYSQIVGGLYLLAVNISQRQANNAPGDAARGSREDSVCLKR